MEEESPQRKYVKTYRRMLREYENKGISDRARHEIAEAQARREHPLEGKELREVNEWLDSQHPERIEFREKPRRGPAALPFDDMLVID